MLRSIVAVTACALVAGGASAELIERTGRFGGLSVTYKVLLPPGYDAAREYPTVLVFTGGPQRLAMAESTIDTDWRTEAEARGYIVVSPGAPDGALFFDAAERVFPEFLDALLADYKIAGGKLHVAGHSNGGLSAFHVAARHPTYFRTVTGYPGLLNESDRAPLAALAPLCIFMHVGDLDSSWLAAMRRQADTMRERGFRVALTVEKNQPHRLRAADIGLSKRVFDAIETCE